MPVFPVIDAATGNQLSWVAFAANVGLHFTQVPLMLAMLRDNDAQSLSRYVSLPSLLQASACSLWLGYGLYTLSSTPLVANNTIGTALSLFYVICFVIKRPSPLGKAIVAGAWLLAISASLLIYGLLYGGPARAAGADAVAAAICIAVTAFFWASPLRALQAAAVDLDDSRVPIFLSLVMMATVVLWLAAGLLLGDVALVVCSAIGVAFTGLQFFVMGYIKWKKRGAKAGLHAAGLESPPPTKGLLAVRSVGLESPTGAMATPEVAGKV